MVAYDQINHFHWFILNNFYWATHMGDSAKIPWWQSSTPALHWSNQIISSKNCYSHCWYFVNLIFKEKTYTNSYTKKLNTRVLGFSCLFLTTAFLPLRYKSTLHCWSKYPCFLFKLAQQHIARLIIIFLNLNILLVIYRFI